MADLVGARRPRIRPLETAALFALGIGALYLGQGIFIPLVLAVLVAFALNPIVELLRRLGLPQLLSVLVTVMLVTGVALLAGYVMVSQLLKLAVDLPQYQQTIGEKLRALQGGGVDGPFGRLAKSLEELGKQVSPTGTSGSQPAPLPVTIADRPASPLAGLTGVFGSILGPLATGTLVFIFSVFLLLERVELRDRFLKLVSLGDLRTSTKVMDESAGRVSRYLLVQLAINCSFGIVFGAGMFLLGVPNAVLWGLLAIIFRYIPFVGTFAAVLFPAALAFAVDPGWTMLLGVLGLYLALELLTTNAIEPNLYGTSTGLSPMAVLIAAIFWATLWGLVGLVLATPLTVCLVVLGRYVPQLGFLDILLGSEPVLRSEERFYQRLLAGNVAEAIELTETELVDGNAAEFFDRVAIPALRLAETDLQRDSSDLGRRRNVVEVVTGVIEELDTQEAVEADQTRGTVLVIGGRTELDGATASMLGHALSAAGIEARQAPPMSLNRDGIVQLDLSASKVVCLCYLDPRPQAFIRYASARLHRKKPGITVLACMFGNGAEIEAVDLSVLRADAVARSIEEATKYIKALLEAPPAVEGSRVVSKPAEDPRLDHLRRFASESDWLAGAAQAIAEEFRVPLAMAQLAPLEPATATAAHRGLAQRVLAAGEPIMISDATLDKEAVDDAFLVENGFRAFLGVPLKVASGETIGTVAIYDNAARDFSSELPGLVRRTESLMAQLEARTETTSTPPGEPLRVPAAVVA